MIRTLIATALLAASSTAAAVTVDFEDYTGPLTAIPGPVSSTGFTFSGTGNPNPIAMADSFVGSSGIALLYCPGCEITMTADSGDAFSLLSADLQNSGSGTIDVIGFYSGGGSIQATLSPGSGFSNFSFGAGWNNLSSLRFVGDFSGLGAGIDTVEVNVVPIPAAVWLFASSLGLLGWLRRD